ncbi:MAG: hypothetical protein WBC44_08790 [Planctomycetaceae bacterium]
MKSLLLRDRRDGIPVNRNRVAPPVFRSQNEQETGFSAPMPKRFGRRLAGVSRHGSGGAPANPAVPSKQLVDSGV